MDKKIDEMICHLDNALKNINILLNEQDYESDELNICCIKEEIINLKFCLKKINDVSNINIEKVKKISNMIYDLNYENSFSVITDSISNEFYAFEFILQEMLIKRSEV